MESRQILENVNASLESRNTAATRLKKDPGLITQAVASIINKEEEYALKALYSLEVLFSSHIKSLEPHFPPLIKIAPEYKSSSARRCFAKIFGFGISEFKKPGTNFSLDKDHRLKIIEISFSWLLSEKSVAVKVFSMQNIYDLRAEENWISSELKAILEKDLANSTAGYRSRGRKILRNLRD